MVYASNLQAVQETGVGVSINNELLGTGDSSNKSFDLANGNVISNSYTVKVSTVGDDENDFFNLTETTDYTIDKDGGTILLTTDGVDALDEDRLYIDYTHSPKISDSTLTSWQDATDQEVDLSTGNYWGTAKVSTQFFDGDFDTYPTTDEPYSRDTIQPETFQLKNKGVLSIQAASILSRGQALSKVWRYDSVGTSFTDVTSEANSAAGSAFQPFADTTAAGDYLYIGSAQQFLELNLVLFSVGVTAGTNTIEYHNGTTWVDFTSNVTESATGVLDFESSGKLSWALQPGWSQVDVNSSGLLYFIRIKAAAVYSTEAKINALYMGQDSVINRLIPLYNLTFSSIGQVDVFSTDIPTGVRNFRVDYQHGYTSVPPSVQEYASLIVGLRIAAKITGGSYDDATVFTLGRKSVSIGEVYVNVREVTSQFRARIKDLLNSIGVKMDVV